MAANKVFTKIDKHLFVGTSFLTLYFLLAPNALIDILIFSIPTLAILTACFYAIKSQNTVGIILIIVAVVGIAVSESGLLLGTLAIVSMPIMWFVIQLLPTFVNFVISYGVTKALIANDMWKILVFVLISILLGFNVKVPYLISDYIDRDEMNITKQLIILPNEFLSIETNETDWPTRPWLFTTPPPHFKYWSFKGVKPLFVSRENIENTLSIAQIPYNLAIGSKNILRLDVNSSSDKLIISASVIDQGQVAATLKLSRRLRFPLEFPRGAEEPSATFFERLGYLLHSNIWNHILDKTPSNDSAMYHYAQEYSVLAEFIKKAASTKGHQKNINTNFYEAVLEDTPLSSYLSNKELKLLPQSCSGKKFTFKDGNTIEFINKKIEFRGMDGTTRSIKLLRSENKQYLGKRTCLSDRMLIVEPIKQKQRKYITGIVLNSKGEIFEKIHIYLPKDNNKKSSYLNYIRYQDQCFALSIQERGRDYYNPQDKKYVACPN